MHLFYSASSSTTVEAPMLSETLSVADRCEKVVEKHRQGERLSETEMKDVLAGYNQMWFSMPAFRRSVLEIACLLLAHYPSRENGYLILGIRKLWGADITKKAINTTIRAA